MTAGKYDRRITLQRATATDDGFSSDGEISWSDIATVWSSATPVRDSEKIAAGQTLATIVYRFEIRFSSTVADLGPKDRVLFDGLELNIHGVKPIGRREGLEITAAAEVT
jgi:SPP1 family predicted phage head-tail adaptor